MNRTHSMDAEGLEPLEQARKAIRHILRRIKDDPFVAWYLGVGTESFELLVEAFATLTGDEKLDILERFLPVEAKDPREEKVGKESEEDVVDLMQESDVLDFIDDSATFERITLLEQIFDRFCKRCGGKKIVGACGCLSVSLRPRFRQTEEAR